MSSAVIEEQAVDLSQPIKLLPFGKKANRFIARTPAQDARLNILVGSVRSAKTWALLTKIIALCYYQIAGQKILTGASKQAIVRNVLTDLFDVVGEDNYTYNRQSGELNLLGCKWVVLGASDEGSEKSIRGMTVGAAVCDEIVLMPRSFCMQLMARMSPEGARLYASTNPDSPYHWFKQEIIDSTDLIHGVGMDIWDETWTMDDNPNLSEQFKAFTKRKYTGVWFQRFIQGMWTVASGAIYRDVLTEDVFYTEETKPIGLLTSGHERIVAVDAGTVNAQVYGMFIDDGRTIWLDSEYYFDSRKENVQKTNGEYADHLIHGFRDWPGLGLEQRVWPMVIVDPSAASFKIELLSRGIFVIDADNSVEDGIRRVSAMLGRKKLRINRRCTNIIRDMETYSWNEKLADNGKEQPIKAHDHGCDCIRYLTQTRINDWRIAA